MVAVGGAGCAPLVQADSRRIETNKKAIVRRMFIQKKFSLFRSLAKVESLTTEPLSHGDSYSSPCFCVSVIQKGFTSQSCHLCKMSFIALAGSAIPALVLILIPRATRDRLGVYLPMRVCLVLNLPMYETSTRLGWLWKCSHGRSRRSPHCQAPIQAYRSTLRLCSFSRTQPMPNGCSHRFRSLVCMFRASCQTSIHNQVRWHCRCRMPFLRLT